MANGAVPVIACVGAGRMGRGIAHCFAYAGFDVRLVDAKRRSPADQPAFFEQTHEEIRGSLTTVADLGGFDRKLVEKIAGRVSVFSRDNAPTALDGVRFVFEAVPETDEAKRDALTLIDETAGADAIVASTTSTYLSTQLSVWSGRPARFLNAHWLNPAFIVPLVELSPTDETDPAVVKETKALLEGIGKVPVVCKASPGYIVPRIQALAMNEAARLVEEGVASAEDIDKAVKYGFGFRFAVLGLLEFIDWGGGDILYHASRYLSDAMDDPRFAAPKIVQSNMAGKRNGLRDGKGFYDYADIRLEDYRRTKMTAFMQSLENAGLLRKPVL
ncbi:MAG TPA: 3-hydroxybutyryl-CoA dehydrogenase [Rhizobiaceae bacterium]|nr:3-hydroxybutyryl-CoA dehydrogenase [Rhizobiaceae bacterium]